MDIRRCIKESFVVIGKEGTTKDGDGFIQKLWDEANNHFNEIESLLKINESGNPVGFWGVMSNFSKSFQPWENNFTEGLYLAGAEVKDDSEPPIGWTKWIVPSYEYLYVKVDNSIPETFSAMIEYIEINNFKLAGAVHDFICPEENGQSYMFFPIRKLQN